MACLMLCDLFSAFDPGQSGWFKTWELAFWVTPLFGLVLLQPGYWVGWGRHRQLVKEACRVAVGFLRSCRHPEMALGLSTVFLTLLWLNLSGLLPYTFVYSAQLVFVFPLAVLSWLGIFMSGATFWPRKVLGGLLPKGVSLSLMPFLVLSESISKGVQSQTLTLRLVANLTGGHIMLSLVASLLTVSVGSVSLSSLAIMPVLAALYGLELIVALLQAYVFCLLLSLYLGEHPF